MTKDLYGLKQKRDKLGWQKEAKRSVRGQMKTFKYQPRKEVIYLGKMSSGEASAEVEKFISAHRSDRDETLAHKILEFLRDNPRILNPWGYVKKSK